MHVATVTEKNAFGLEPGDYVSEDINAAEMLGRGWASEINRKDAPQPRKFDPELNWDGRSILFVRPGGFGDLLFLTPTMREIKRRWTTAEICVACFDRFEPVLENNPDVAELIRYPIALNPSNCAGSIASWGDFDAHIWLENIIEKNPDALNTHAVDLIADRCGIKLADKQMRYYVTTDEFQEAREEFPGEPIRSRRIGIQMSASGSCRMYPHMQEVSIQLWREGCEIFLFGAAGEIKSNEPDGLVNLMQRGKSFRESCAILATCDCLVAPDSALTHVAGALGVPCVALYGPFPWTLRTAYAPKTFAIQGVGACSPCFWHGRHGDPFPEHGPCFRTGRCEVLASIPVDRVVREVMKKLENPARMEAA